MKTPDLTECWLRRCHRPATERIQIGGYGLVLCSTHRYELDVKADEATGYSTAEPPKGYTTHWPWKVVQLPNPTRTT